MAFLETLARAFLGNPEDFQERSEFPGMDEQIAAIRRTQYAERPWRPAAVSEALGVPSILSAVSLISGVAGSLSMEGFRAGSLMADAPRLIQRPNPRTTPGVFYRDTAFYHASRGEFWWWIAHRDIDGNADALYPVPPWELTVTANQNDRLRPEIKWGSRVMRNEDMRQHMYLPGPDGLRGVGPLQLAGAAVSVAHEASHWAANFFSGNLPSLVGTTDQDLDETDLKALDAQWAEKQGNTPRWLTQNMKLEAAPFDAQKAQLTDTRSFQVGEVARMFLIPGPLLEYQMSGSSLTYRNEEDIWTDFQRRCLSPQYLEPIEQEMSDLMPRTTVGRFNLEQLLRADTKSRYEAWKFGMDAGWLTAEEVRKKEGLEPGNVDFAPVPFSPPGADLNPIPQNRSMAPVRCSSCNWLFGELSAPYSVACRRCKTLNIASEPLQERSDPLSAALAMLATREPINIHPPSITVESPQITFERGAFQVDAPEPAQVNVTTPDVQIEVAAPDMSGVAEALVAVADRPQPDIHVDGPAITVAAPDMSEVAGAITAIADRPQPEIRVEAPITVEPAQVTVNVPEQRPITREIKHNKDGKIIQIREVPA
jgi:HK97 family phage portal protein